MHRIIPCMLMMLLASGLSCLVGCKDDESDVDDRARLELMEQDILDYVGEPACNGIEGCRYIGMGDKPCGGPWYYLIYSASNVDSLVLAEMVSEYNRFNEELNRKYGWISDCSVPNPPILGCQEGVCVDVGPQRD